jgi:hypothetical protein
MADDADVRVSRDDRIGPCAGLFLLLVFMLAYWSGQFPFGGASYREYLSALRLIQP